MRVSSLDIRYAFGDIYFLGQIRNDLHCMSNSLHVRVFFIFFTGTFKLEKLRQKSPKIILFHC